MMFRKIAVLAVGTAGVIPIVGVVASCKEKSSGRVLRPSQLPIYESPQDIYDYEYYVNQPTTVEEYVKESRNFVNQICVELQPYKTRATEIYETGKAHTIQSFEYLVDESNILPRAGAITLAGLLGFLIASRRRGFFRKIMYTSIGSGTMAALCYPKEATAFAQLGYQEGQKYSAIGYNFVAGVKPGSAAPAEKEEVKSTPVVEQHEEEEKKPEEKTKPKSTDKPEEKAKPTDKKPEEKAKPTDKKPEEKTKPKSTDKKFEDFGQSKKEDSDMYTTRGK